MSLNVDLIRKEFPQLKTKIYGKDLVYFDNAATTLKPHSVIEKSNDYLAKYTANIHRGIHYLSEKGTVDYEGTRDHICEFIGANSRQEIIFTKGTTESINLVASSFGESLNPGDEILLSMLEHHSNIVPWQLIAEKKKAKIKVIPINELGELDLTKLGELLTNKTKIVSINFVSNSLGTINDIKTIIKMAHETNAKVLIDAAQAVSHLKVDVKELDCDFLAFSAHKLFGPTGFGVLYGKEELLDKMPPYQGGGDMIDVVTFDKTTFNELPHKFEAGTPPIAEGIAFKESIKFMQQYHFNDIHEYETNLLNYATNKLKEIKNLTIYGEAKNKSAVISFAIKNVHHQDLAMYLDRQGIALRTGHHCTQPLMKFFNISGTSRVSFSFYNTKTEIDYFIESLNKAMEILL